MVKTEINNNKSVYGIEKSLLNSRIVLKWKSSGLSEFIVFYSEKKENLIFESKNSDLLIKSLGEIENGFVSEKKAQMKNGTSCFYVTLDELKRDGGLQIKNRPGYYAVYGISISDEDFTVYIEEINHLTNMFFMTVDVVISKKPSYISKGFIKKKEQYSGYTRISLTSAYPSLMGGVLKYNIDGYGYPFPDDVVKNGGSFFIKATENQQIDFDSSIQGIIIK